MPSVFYRPSGTPSNSGWSANPHLAIDEVTASESDYAFCAATDDAYDYKATINLTGSSIIIADIISITWRYRMCVVDSAGSPTSANSGQVGGIIPFGINIAGSLQSPPPSTWMTYTVTRTKAQMDTQWPGYNWNSPSMQLYSYKTTNVNRLAISWLEIEFDMADPSGIPLYHLLNIM